MVEAEQLEVDDPFAAADAKIAVKDAQQTSVDMSMSSSNSRSRRYSSANPSSVGAKNEILYGEKFIAEVTAARNELLSQIMANRD